MLKLKLIKISILSFAALALAACGSGGGEAPATLSTISGQVADGYLVNARVFLDRDGDRLLDADEPWTLSGTGGVYTLDVAQGEGMRHPVVVEAIAGQTTDEDLPGETIQAGYVLMAPAGEWDFISPLTTLVKVEMDKNPSISKGAAASRIRARLGLAGGVNLFDDYLSGAGLDAGRTHDAARMVAGLMGDLQTAIESNVGATEAEARKAALLLLISDQLEESSAAIAQAIPSAGDPASIETAEKDILSGIDTASFDLVLLDRYGERLRQGNPVWDMRPPQLTNQVPPTAGSASVDGVISLRFDEALDPNSISNEALKLIGANGPVPGTVSYDPALKQLSFTPDQLLTAYSSYRVELAGLADQAGNPMQKVLSWNFSTIFDQQPPALPQF